MCDVFVDPFKVPLPWFEPALYICTTLHCPGTLKDGKANLSFNGNRGRWPIFRKDLRSNCDQNDMPNSEGCCVQSEEVLQVESKWSFLPITPTYDQYVERWVTIPKRPPACPEVAPNQCLRRSSPASENGFRSVLI